MQTIYCRTNLNSTENYSLFTMFVGCADNNCTFCVVQMFEEVDTCSVISNVI